MLSSIIHSFTQSFNDDEDFVMFEKEEHKASEKNDNDDDSDNLSHIEVEYYGRDWRDDVESINSNNVNNATGNKPPVHHRYNELYRSRSNPFTNSNNYTSSKSLNSSSYSDLIETSAIEIVLEDQVATSPPSRRNTTTTTSPPLLPTPTLDDDFSEAIEVPATQQQINKKTNPASPARSYTTAEVSNTDASSETIPSNKDKDNNTGVNAINKRALFRRRYIDPQRMGVYRRCAFFPQFNAITYTDNNSTNDNNSTKKKLIPSTPMLKGNGNRLRKVPETPATSNSSQASSSNTNIDSVIKSEHPGCFEDLAAVSADVAANMNTLISHAMSDSISELSIDKRIVTPSPLKQTYQTKIITTTTNPNNTNVNTTYDTITSTKSPSSPTPRAFSQSFARSISRARSPLFRVKSSIRAAAVKPASVVTAAVLSPSRGRSSTAKPQPKTKKVKKPNAARAKRLKSPPKSRSALSPFRLRSNPKPNPKSAVVPIQQALNLTESTEERSLTKIQQQTFQQDQRQETQFSSPFNSLYSPPQSPVPFIESPLCVATAAVAAAAAAANAAAFSPPTSPLDKDTSQLQVQQQQQQQDQNVQEQKRNSKRNEQSNVPLAHVSSIALCQKPSQISEVTTPNAIRSTNVSLGNGQSIRLDDLRFSPAIVDTLGDLAEKMHENPPQDQQVLLQQVATWLQEQERKHGISTRPPKYHRNREPVNESKQSNNNKNNGSDSDVDSRSTSFTQWMNQLERHDSTNTAEITTNVAKPKAKKSSYIASLMNLPSFFSWDDEEDGEDENNAVEDNDRKEVTRKKRIEIVNDDDDLDWDDMDNCSSPLRSSVISFVSKESKDLALQNQMTNDKAKTLSERVRQLRNGGNDNKVTDDDSSASDLSPSDSDDDGSGDSSSGSNSSGSSSNSSESSSSSTSSSTTDSSAPVVKSVRSRSVLLPEASAGPAKAGATLTYNSGIQNLMDNHVGGEEDDDLSLSSIEFIPTENLVYPPRMRQQPKPNTASAVVPDKTRKPTKIISPPDHKPKRSSQQPTKRRETRNTKAVVQTKRSTSNNRGRHSGSARRRTRED